MFISGKPRSGVNDFDADYFPSPTPDRRREGFLCETTGLRNELETAPDAFDGTNYFAFCLPCYGTT